MAMCHCCVYTKPFAANKKKKMKNFYLKLLVILCFSSCNTQGGEGIKFKKKINPDRSYKTEMTTTSYSELVFEASHEILEKLKEAGIPVPTVMVDSTEMNSEMITGQLKSENFSILMKFDTLDKKQIMNGIYGNSNRNGEIEIDSIRGNLEEETKTSLKQILEGITKTIPFPEKQMKIGDKFKQEVPFSIPIPGFEPVDLEIITTYELKEIRDEIAYFDTYQKYKLNMDIEQLDTKVTGSGNGRIEFDLKESFATYYESIADMDLEIKANSVIIKNKSKTTSKQKVKIERNKAAANND